MPTLLALALLLAAPPEAAVSAALAAGVEAGPARAVAATAPLLGVRYLPDPLGEGSGPDPDPRFRLDAFDCMTLAETAVALGSAATLDEARRALDDVRYAGAIELAGRNHEVVSQWLPANLEKGWVAPLPRDLAGAVVTATVEYDPARWARLDRAGQRLSGVPPARRPVGRFTIEVVPLSALAEVGPRLPEGALAFVVRQDGPDVLTRVSHVGLVVVRHGVRLVRHASSWPGVMRVVEEPLPLFVERQRQASRRRLVGLAFYVIQDNRSRLVTLPPS